MRVKRSAQQARYRRNRNRRLAAAARRSFRCESLESRVMLDGGGLVDGGVLELLPPPYDPSAISGRVWVDTDGSREWDGAEVGQGGVMVYSDLNFNGVLDAHEPRAITQFDDPVTDFDEGGLYTLENLQPGWHNVRQVTPSGFEQTYPALIDGYLPPPWGDASVHVTFVDAGVTVDGVDFGNRPLPRGSISGVKWNDANGNAERDPGEVGLAGVTIYADLNNNGQFDSQEPSTVTTADIPETDFDEGGRYTLAGLQAGDYVIREVVPAGYQQTYPLTGDSNPFPFEPNDEAPRDELARVDPGRLDLTLADGQVTIQELTLTIDAALFQPINIEVFAQSAQGTHVEFINLSGQQTNGGSGDESVFQLMFIGNGEPFVGELAFFDTNPLIFASPIATIPLTVNSETRGDGAHRVWLDPGEHADGFDFGNQAIERGVIGGVKWEDANNNGTRENNEPGLSGVTIYLDLNHNQQLDADEPSTISAVDNPNTPRDESGWYSFDVAPGLYSVREVMPSGFRQTYPNFDHPTPYPSPLLRPSLPGEEFAHFVSVQAGDVVTDADFGNQRLSQGSISGLKWNDANGNAQRDPDEPGLAGVTIYVDLNNNGQFDANEPSTVTAADNPTTRFNEAGRYRFENLAAGDYVIREVVPDGFRQTFPVLDVAVPTDDAVDDEFATVEPGRIDLELGEVVLQPVSITVHPNVFVPIEIDVVASPAVHFVINTSNPQLNGGGGDTSTFQILILPSEGPYQGELQFIDLAGGNMIGSVPLSIGDVEPHDGAHRVSLNAGEHVDGLDFGNQRTGPATGGVAGRKWLDADGDREQGPNEPGLAGVTIYADLNRNGVFDSDEPSTVTMHDIPETDFDETGLYHLELEAGEHWIAEVVPDGFMQTFPLNVVIAIFPPPPGGDVHFATVVAGQTVEGLDFGNRPVEAGSVSGTVWNDFNGDGIHDPNEIGMSGVTVYADYNFNGQLDVGEPWTETIEDFRDIFPNDTGRYQLDVRPGFTAIRQIVPDGHFQTFPISDAASPWEQGAHFVNVEAGVNIPDLDFGNQGLDNFPSGVSGRKWEDYNANGQRDPDEPGLAGVTIYVDTNLNGVFDANEPSAVTMEDIPETDFDEAGLYSIGNLQAGLNVVREVVPNGFVQTFPVSIAASPLESGAHLVFLAPGEHLDGLNFGNLRFGFPLPGDFNADGIVDEHDLQLWEDSYGESLPPSGGNNVAAPMSGSDFLNWQQNLGRTTTLPPIDGGEGALTETQTVPTGLQRGIYRPSTREPLEVLEAVFADEVSVTSESAAAVLAPASSSLASESSSVRGAVAPRADYAAIAAAIDAALEDESEL